MILIGHIPIVIFLPCSTVIADSLDTTSPSKDSAQWFLKELHTERFSIISNKRYKGFGTESIRNHITNLIINPDFEKKFNETQDTERASNSVEALGLALSVLETSERSEFSFSNLHVSIFELAKDINDDVKISKVIIVCNCSSKINSKDAKDILIKEMKEKQGKITYNYDKFEILNTQEIMGDNEYYSLLKH